MDKVFSPSKQQVFLIGHHNVIPGDARPITAEDERYFVGNCPIDQVVGIAPDGKWIHIPAPEAIPSEESLCLSMDRAADVARAKVAGDPLRAVEYDRAAVEAAAFKAADYQGEVPRTVAAWAINGRTPQQAADSILAEANAYTEALYCIRETRLQAKESIRTLMKEGNIKQAQEIATAAISKIEAAIAGVGNNSTTLV